MSSNCKKQIPMNKRPKKLKKLKNKRMRWHLRSFKQKRRFLGRNYKRSKLSNTKKAQKMKGLNKKAIYQIQQI